jgi:hypothetical protein
MLKVVAVEFNVMFRGGVPSPKSNTAVALVGNAAGEPKNATTNLTVTGKVEMIK